MKVIASEGNIKILISAWDLMFLFGTLMILSSIGAVLSSVAGKSPDVFFSFLVIGLVGIFITMFGNWYLWNKKHKSDVKEKKE